MITNIDHIGIAVRSIDETAKIYIDALGLKIRSFEVLDDQKARTAIIPIGKTKIELIESTAPDGAIAKFIESRGEGLHHIAFEVEDIKRALAEMVKKGIPLVDEKPRKGVENMIIAFLHPKGTGRVLLEFVEH
jgi:methylmalonyl-CoA epimerase